MRVHIRKTLLSASIAAILTAGVPAHAQELPVPCAGGSCGATGPATWVTEGSVTGSVSEGTFNILQSTDFATLNWASFNIGEGGRVEFVQPDESSIALNRIFQNDPSRIFGALEANGQVYLLNQNGFLFGENSTVNVATLIASSLDLTPEAVENGILGAGRNQAPAFAAFTDAEGNPVLSGAIDIAQGAFLGAEGGRILIFAPEVTNRGTIETPEGQTILAAGSRIYLAASQDDGLVGLIVEVDGEGVVTNGDGTLDAGELVGRISADRGNITLAGLAVNQLGRVSATTSVRQNGSIRLVARNDVTISGSEIVTLQARQGGTLTLGEGSQTEVLLELDDPSATVDVNEQPRSRIDMAGRQISIERDAQVRANGGIIEVFAAEEQQQNPANFVDVADASRIDVAQGAVLDVSGASANRSVTDNVIDVELRGNQLADSPLQRDGALRSETVRVDIRQRGVRADGSEWQGTPLADASGEISNIDRTVAERNLAGGEIRLQSQGAVVVNAGASLDVSGGVVTYEGGDVATSQLLGADGQVYDIADADRDREYVSLIDSFTVEHPRWGVTEVFPGFQRDEGGTFEPGYVEGYDAGAVTILAPNFALDGVIRATTVAGRYQRQLAGELPAGTLYRPFDELPLGGQLLIGNTTARGELTQFVTGSVRFGELDSASALGGLEDVAGYTSILRPSLFGAGGITRLGVAANGTISVPEDVRLLLGPNGELLASASRIEFDGRLDAAGGVVDLLARRTRAISEGGVALHLGESAVLDVSGTWVNDNRELGDTFLPLPLNGGRVSVFAESGSATLTEGSLIDVSGGAQRTVDGTIVAGDAGSIDIGVASNPDTADFVDLQLGATLRAFGLENGGSLSVTANGICIADTDCAVDNGTLWLTPDLFVDSGFNDLRFTANLTGLLVSDDTAIQLQQRNFELPATTRFLDSTRSLTGIADTALLPDLFRAPVNLSLNAFVTDFPDFDFSAVSLEPGLRIATGSTISLDPGAELSIESNALAVISGRIRALGGQVRATVNNDLQGNLTRPPAGLWVTPEAAIDVSGTSLVFTDDLGRRVGRVLDGGLISLTAERGGISVATGSQLLLRGATEELDVLTGPLTSPAFDRRVIASDAGTLAMAAAEYVLLDADVDASAANEFGAESGTLSLTIDGNLRGNELPFDGLGNPLVSLNNRRIVVERNRSAIALPVGEQVPDNFIGVGRISEALIEESGFANVFLSAESLFSQNDFSGGFFVGTGAIEFGGGVDLSLAGTLSLSAAGIYGGAGDVTLDSSYLALGYGIANALDIGAPADARVGTLTASADLLDVFGFSRIGGFESVQLSAERDVRFTGIQPRSATPGALGGDPRTIVGGLTTAAELTLTAAQLYPTTITDFDVTVEGVDGTLRILGNGAERSDVLSAGGRLELSAAEIVNEGVLRAPFGELVLNGDSVTLADGSVTSTSLDDQIVPFGSLQGGFDWTYGLDRNQTLVFDGTVSDLPSPNVRLVGDSIDVAAGSTIDISAGGDLLAFEFVTGIGGTDDFLSPTVSPGLFAILPGLDLPYAPIDPQIANEGATGLDVGDTVFLNGIGNLQSGTYTLLPARYAILPGAVLVRPVDGYTDILPGERFESTAGNVVVAGQLGNRSGRLDSRTSGIEVLSRSQAFAASSYTLSTATTFFAESGFRTPNDAGSAAFAANSALSLVGDLTAATTIGRGAAVDIASADLRIVDTLSDGIEGVVEVRADDLENLDAESILLGGERTQGAEGESIRVIAGSVTLEEGVELSAPDIVLAATDSVTLESGSRLVSEGNASDAATTLLDGDSALLRARNGNQPDTQRSNALGQRGDITIAENASVVSSGAVALDATGDVTVDGSLDVDEGSLRFAVRQTTIGDSETDVGGLRLTNSLLAGINADELIISGSQPITVFGDSTIAVAERLVIDSPGLTATEGATLTLQAPALEISGSATDSVVDSMVQMSTRLQIDADHIDFGGGNVVFNGFERADLTATETVGVSGSGSFATSGALTIDSPLLEVSSVGDLTLSAGGALSLLGGADVVSAGAGPGGRLVLAGDSVTLGTTIRAESGVVAINAIGDVRLTEDARIDTGGLARAFADVTLATPGGNVTVTSATGDLTFDTGSAIDVSAPADGDAGSISLVATDGVISANATLAGTGSAGSGDLLVSGRRLSEFGALLQATDVGGFAGDLRFEQRDGSLAVTANRSLQSRSIAISAGGDLDIAGALTLQGGDGLFVAGEAVSLSGSITSVGEASDSGSRVSLYSDNGTIALNAGSRIQLGQNDTLTLTLDRDVLLGGGLDLDGNIVGGRAVFVDGLASYQDDRIAGTDTLAQDSNPYFSDAAAFVGSTDTLAETLGFAGDDRFVVRPAVTIESTGDLTVADDFDLYGWEFDTGVAGVLTLRAAGDLIFEASLSDAFDGINNDFLESTDDSWSFRLVAGADLGAADPMTVLNSTAGGDVLVGGVTEVFGNPVFTGATIRTGNGNIDVAAARDIVLRGQNAVIYTSGIATEGVPLTGRGELGNRTYPDQGGDISLTAGRDVLGALSDQLFTSWLWRTGREINASSPSATGWTIDFGSFEQNIGALGGGNIQVMAGRDINELSINIPSIGRQVGGTSVEDSRVEVIAGGDLSVSAGGDLLGGTYLIGLGDAEFSIGGDVGPADSFSPIFGIGDGRVDLRARGSVSIAGATSPTLLLQGDQQRGAAGLRASFFSTYTDTAELALASLSGDVVLGSLTGQTPDLVARFSGLNPSGQSVDGIANALTILPPSLSLTAHGGDVRVEGSVSLFPSTTGNLEIFAEDNVVLGNPDEGIRIVQSDALASQIGTIDTPRGERFDPIPLILNAFDNPNFNAPVPLYAGNNGFNRVVARTGDVEMVSQTLTSQAVLYSPRQIQVTAGQDIVNLGLLVQHPDVTNVTSLQAGRDIIYLNSRSAEGLLEGNDRAIEVAGAGNLLLIAGRDIDFQTSAGITTSGDLDNPALNTTGASVSLLAGLNGNEPDFAAFIDTYLLESDLYDAVLLEFVSAYSEAVITTKDQALSQLQVLDQRTQFILLERILFDELRASGREAANPGELNSDFTRGFEALTTLFPGANPDLEGGEVNAYDGDISLFFSRIYTLDGGDIQLIVPGGEVNAGLASPPTAFGIVKGPEDLGIVAQGIGDINSVSFGDFAVNESRVFAADGGNILIWSTRGDIDAGRGAKTAISAPPPQITIDPTDGSLQVIFPAALTGSGIQTIATSEGTEPGDVDLFAPRGVVNAGDAGIVAGNLTVAAVAVLGADNIDVSGVSVGVPVDTAVAPGLANVSAVASGAQQAAQEVVEPTAGENGGDTPLADAALGFLDVFVVSFGDCNPETGENCADE